MVIKALSEYRIPYKGLSNGNNSFLFEIESNFFSNFEKSNIKEGKYEVELNLDKRDDMIVMYFDISGYYAAACDRCLAPIEVAMNFEEKIIVKFDDGDDKCDEALTVSPKSDYLELSGLIYELIHVHLPLQNVRDCEADRFKFCDKTATLYSDHGRLSVSKEKSIWDELKNIKRKS